MTSFVSRLARTLSQGSGGIDCPPPPHHRLSSSHESLETTVETLAESLQPKLSASPSFNDFSLRTEEDALEELGCLSPSWTTHPANQVAAASVQSQSTLKTKRRTKIMGMDAYDYCDLIRTSSM